MLVDLGCVKLLGLQKFFGRTVVNPMSFSEGMLSEIFMVTVLFHVHRLFSVMRPDII